MTDSNNQSKRGWYVLRAISGKEAKVKEILDAQIRNTDLGKSLFQVLIPTEKVMTVRNGKKVVKERNLYSGYVFIEAELCGEVNDYMVGETVKVNEGPFNGFTGTIEKVDREKKKLTVMVKIFGRPNPLELDNSQVERE